MKRTLSEREKKMLVALAILVVTMGFYNFIYQPQRLALLEIKGELEQKKAKYDRIQQLIAEKKAWENRGLNQDPFSLADLLAQVNNLAAAAGVEIKSFRPEESPQEGSEEMTKISPVVLRITLEGDFASLEGFLSSWEKLVPGGILTSLDIVPTKNTAKLQANLVVKALLL